MGILLAIAGKSIAAVMGQIVSAAVSKKVLMRLMIIFIDKLVKSTKTNTDNRVWLEIKSELVKHVNGDKYVSK